MTGANHSMTLIKQELNRRKTQRDLQEENGRAAVNSMDYRKKYDLGNEEWKYDIMPEIVDDKNIADFVDPEIMAKLEQLEQEEEAREAVRDVTNDAEVGGYRIITTAEKEVVKKIMDSSFINKITIADVDVQPYAFTTKSLFVGHCDYKYLRWHVIDTPGILDHELESRNTIEMQSITALSHL